MSGTPNATINVAIQFTANPADCAASLASDRTVLLATIHGSGPNPTEKLTTNMTQATALRIEMDQCSPTARRKAKVLMPIMEKMMRVLWEMRSKNSDAKEVTKRLAREMKTLMDPAWVGRRVARIDTPWKMTALMPSICWANMRPQTVRAERRWERAVMKVVKDTFSRAESADSVRGCSSAKV